jgi:glycosyltransferase involved in cell wall biosynthesis
MAVAENYDIIILHLTRIDDGFQSSGVTYSKELSKQHRVFLIDRPLTIKDIWQHRKDAAWQSSIAKSKKKYGHAELVNIDGFEFYSVTPPYTLSVNFIKNVTLYNALSAINHYVFNRFLQKLITDFNIKHYVVINSFNPFLLVPFPKLSPAPLVKIYRCIDEMSEVDYIARHGVRLEREAVKSYDFTIATSTPIWRRLKGIQPNTYLVPNGADTDMFETALQDLPMPSDLPKNGKKNVVFVGNMNKHRMDYGLVVKAAQACPELNFIAIGPYKQQDYVEFGFDTLPNVFFIGPRKMGTLPAYLKYAHCTLIPYLKNGLTAGIYPLKMNEYLAAGQPVVCTNFSEELNHFSEVIYIADSEQEFIAAIKKAVNEHTSELIALRQNVAAKNKWSYRMAQIRALIQEYAKP